jgi:hypothetical protein
MSLEAFRKQAHSKHAKKEKKGEFAGDIKWR